MQKNKKITRYDFGKIPEIIKMPHLLEIQKKSFEWFLDEGIQEALRDISPIEDFTGNMSLEFKGCSWGEPNAPIDACRMENMDYAAPLKVRARFVNKETGEYNEQDDVFLGDFPIMTDTGTFIINGTERVVVSQLVRSPGAYYDSDIDKKKEKVIYLGKLIPARGSWIEIETDKKDVAYVRIDRKRKFLLTIFLKSCGFGNNQDLLNLFGPFDKVGCIKNTLEKDITETEEGALIEFYKKLKPGEPSTRDSAKSLITQLFFNSKRYDLGKVGRHKLNKKLDIETPLDPQIEEYLKTIDEKIDINGQDLNILHSKDIFLFVKYLLQLMDGIGEIDDIDHFGNRRIRNIGELIQNQVRIGLSRMERVVKERMTTQDIETITPKTLINIRPLVAALKEFFGSGQLSQFLDQTNPLAEITHKRRLSALGPGGLSRERAGFEVRDVHSSHYGRMCPIETPEGPNIGLIGSLATYARLNEHGFIETAYRKVLDGKVTDDFEYLTADDEEKFTIAQATAELSKDGKFIEEKVLARLGGEVVAVDPDQIDFMDISPKQLFSAAASLIPFLEHDDANRALMGSNMQRQAVPLINPEPPLVGTGMEKRIAHDSGQIITAKHAGKVIEVSGDRIVIEYKGDGKSKTVLRDEYKLYKFRRSNQGTCINQRPIVEEGQIVEDGEVIADGPATSSGELSLGRNLLVAFMPWEGYNYEDAIVISERLVKEDILSSIHISKHEIEARSTKLGPEEITRDIPNVSEELLKNLDERGIIRLGAEVKPGDILVGKITPKGETELTAEEKLLRAIFGEKAREVRDSSLKVPHGESGKVIDIQISSKKKGNELPPGVNELVRVFIARKRKISVGDKLAGRHGNKGVISVILPEEDMPYMEDGTPVDIVLNPMGVPSRMNVGQILETHLGWAAYEGWDEPDNPELKNIRKEDGKIFCATPIFDSAKEEKIKEILKKAKLPANGKVALYDGKSGGKVAVDITVGYIYILKLHHLVDDKIHARSTGPYSLVTQQPLGGKAQFGGQRFGEMEVWALEAYGASHILQEMLTIKSDDVFGRVKTYESIVKGENIEKPGIPESFKVLVKEMQSLSLDVEVLSEEGKEVEIMGHEDEIMKTVKELGIDLQHDESLMFTNEPEDKKKKEELFEDYSEEEFQESPVE
ncbi:MAG: DNA-directed RNA polymerase subunit beta [Actinobacteria bacterium]|nr:DNA-directed RNA polymerase subunit beta [Actinomycetota bacterium]MCL6087673.1 DNA-directed RNA polymerase subunit beta [Actinomycetota bacterium]